jgi:hypothetical protein
MFAYCLLTTPNYLEAAQVEHDIKEVITRKFNNVLTIEKYINKDEICDWNIVFDSTHWFPICLETHNTIKFQHPDDAFSYYCQFILEGNLAKKYNACFFDEEFPRKDLKLDTEYNCSFRNFLQNTLKYHSVAWKKAIIETEISRLPEELRKL